MAGPDEWERPQRLVAVNASGGVSGAEAVMLDLLALAVADGIEVVVASPPGPLQERLPAGVRHLELPAFGLGVDSGRVARAMAAVGLGLRTVRTGRRLRREVRGAGTRTYVNGLLCLPAVRLARPRHPATWLVHDTATSGFQRAFIRFGRRRLGLVTSVSEVTAEPLRPLGCDVVVRPNGVPWPVDPVALPVGEPPLVGSAALLVPWKGHRVLLEALALLPDVRLELAGDHLPADAAYVDELRTRAAQPDLAGRVALLGRVEGVLDRMRTWDVAVLASTSPEAGPLAVLEAMSLGLPTVATDHGGSAEQLADGAGILVRPGDAEALAAGIRSALDPARRPGLAEAGRRRVAERHDRSVTLPAQYRAVVGAIR